MYPVEQAACKHVISNLKVLLLNDRPLAEQVNFKFAVKAFAKFKLNV